MTAKKPSPTTEAAPVRAAAKRSAAKAAVAPASKTTKRSKVAPVAAVAAAKSAVGPSSKAVKPPKQRARLVRDSFTMPEVDFALIAALKTLALDHKREAKKSELLRAGLHALMAMDGKTLVNALDQLQPLKLGRPKKGH